MIMMRMRMIMVIIYDIWGQLPKYFEPGAQHEGRPAAEDLEGGQGDRQGGVTDCQVEKETGGQALFFFISLFSHRHFCRCSVMNGL